MSTYPEIMGDPFNWAFDDDKFTGIKLQPISKWLKANLFIWRIPLLSMASLLLCHTIYGYTNFDRLSGCYTDCLIGQTIYQSTSQSGRMLTFLKQNGSDNAIFLNSNPEQQPSELIARQTGMHLFLFCYWTALLLWLQVSLCIRQFSWMQILFLWILFSCPQCPLMWLCFPASGGSAVHFLRRLFITALNFFTGTPDMIQTHNVQHFGLHDDRQNRLDLDWGLCISENKGNHADTAPAVCWMTHWASGINVQFAWMVQ